MEKNGRLNDKMQRAVDGRTFIMGFSAIKNFCRQKISLEEKCQKAARLTHCEEYMSAYNRQKEKGNLDSYSFEVIIPGEEADFVKLRCTVMEMERKDRREKRLRALCPDFLFNLYHKTKIRLGMIPPDEKS